MDHVADNILTRLWDTYKKEHPNAKRPPDSLKDKAKELADKGKEKPKEAPKPQKGIHQEHDEHGLSKPVHPTISHGFNFDEKSKDPRNVKVMDEYHKQWSAYKKKRDEAVEKKKSPDEKREDKAKKEFSQAGFKKVEDITSKWEAMSNERYKGMSDEDRKSPAGQHHKKKMDALGKAMNSANAMNKIVQDTTKADGNLNDPKVKAEIDKHTDAALKALETYNALGDAPPKGMTDTIKGLLAKGKSLADKLKSHLSGKKASDALASKRGGCPASDQALVRRTIRLAYARPDLREHLLPIVVDHLAGD